MIQTTKLLEIRDTGTLIPVLAVRLCASCEAERWMLAHCGYGGTVAEQSQYIAVWPLAGGRQVCTTDFFGHTVAGRTMVVAHDYINRHFDELESGAVVDVQFILGATPAPAKSDRFFQASEVCAGKQ